MKAQILVEIKKNCWVIQIPIKSLNLLSKNNINIIKLVKTPNTYQERNVLNVKLCPKKRKFSIT